MNHEEITYACPFCVVDPNDEEVEFEVFEDTEELVSLCVYYLSCCVLLVINLFLTLAYFNFII